MRSVLTRAYRRGEIAAADFPVEDVSEQLAVDDTTVWIDLCDPNEQQLDQLADELGLHELAIEDVLGPHQRPKLDAYATHLFLACHDVRLDLEEGVIQRTEVDAFIGRRWLVTVRKDDEFSIDPVVARVDRLPGLTHHGPTFLLYLLLDEVVDRYFDAVQAFDDYYEAASDSIFEGQPLPPPHQRHWFEMRRSLVQFHRLVVPLREAVSTLMRHDQQVLQPELYPYFQDVYDHILRVGESTESLRELVATIVETNLSLRDYRQNQIVKRVSSWAAIIAVPALITGYFGMNVPFPGSGDTGGVLASTGLIVVASGGLYLVFRRLDWI